MPISSSSSAELSFASGGEVGSGDGEGAVVAVGAGMGVSVGGAFVGTVTAATVAPAFAVSVLEVSPSFPRQAGIKSKSNSNPDHSSPRSRMG